MKIDGFGSGKIERTKKQSKASKSKTVSSAPNSSSEASVTDKIEVSDHLETLDVIRSLVADLPDMRMDEVDRIVSQLREGKYKINFEKVAEGFIKEAILNEMAKKSLGK